MKVEYVDTLSPILCRSYPDKVFIYGDNLRRYGKGGQAIIRDEPNAFGIPTKVGPSWEDWAFFSDKEEEFEAVRSSLRSLYKLSRAKTVVFPRDGVGTGRARIKDKSPIIYAMMCGILFEHFGIVNGVPTKEKL